MPWRFRFATSLLVLATTTQAADPAACAASVSSDAAVRRLNEVRSRGTACHAGTTSTTAALVWNETLAAAALAQSSEMARLDRMSHRDSQNRGLAERLRAQGYRFGVAVENLGVGYASLDDVVDAWLESEGHCENVMNAAVREFGVACVDAAGTGTAEERRYWTLVLGAPPRPR